MNCVTADPLLFDVDVFPGETRAARDTRNHKAATICAGCPVAQACLDKALADRSREGVYAGYQIEIERPAA